MSNQPLSQRLPWDLANVKWAAALNPMLANPFNSTSVLSDVKLKVGTNVINHLLGQTMQGWMLTDIQGVASIYRSAPFNNLTLTLTSDAAVTVSIGVF
jgi:hypothetical protein